LGIENRKPKFFSIFSRRPQIPKKLLKKSLFFFFFERPRPRERSPSAGMSASARTHLVHADAGSRPRGRECFTLR
jgi:hypothetical protein